ncbi:class I SAM-dependent methyltransferase [Methylopila sp. M107]|uniref:class I SAM-dependent methyltransferase n=1 Tax=Methylopila sp. M107 TaxID=1101190 RepID=UPI00037D7B35|nr:class I SAM-dependent methyltransferase [Methylopila sp. M107]
MLAPWIIERFRTSDLGWKAIQDAQFARMTKKNRKRRRRSLLSIFTGSFRSQSFVDKQYTKTWSDRDYPDANNRPAGEKVDYFDWNGHGFVLKLGGSHPYFMEAVIRAIESVKPKSVLEVGAGMGSNLLILANLFPEIAFSGLELTEAGVQRAKGVQATAFPEGLASVSPRPMPEREGFRTIDFQQGNATALPWADASFDAVFTILAVEQMQSVRDKALSEIVRVARSHVILVEPFLDENKDPLRALSKKAKDHLRLSVDDLKRFGLEVEWRFSDWPQKLTEGVGVVVARVVR